MFNGYEFNICLEPQNTNFPSEYHALLGENKKSERDITFFKNRYN